METIKPKVRKPVFFVSYDNKDITAHISPFVISVSYTDNLEGKADEISIDIEDTFHKWKQGWYPVKGDKLSLKMGYEDERLVNCGTFEIDEIEFNGATRSAARGPLVFEGRRNVSERVTACAPLRR